MSSSHSPDQKTLEEKYKRAQKFYLDKNYDSAFPLLQSLAKLNYPPAQAAMGWLYEKGLGVRQDREEARKWYQKAAEKGDARAQFNLGNMYYQELGDVYYGPAYNEAKTMEWWERAGRQGYSHAIIRQHEIFDKASWPNRKNDRIFLTACKRGLVEEKFDPKLRGKEKQFFDYLVKHKEDLLRKTKGNPDHAIVVCLSLLSAQPGISIKAVHSKFKSAMEKMAMVVDGEKEGKQYFSKLEAKVEAEFKQESAEKRIIQKFEKAAIEGNAEAQFNLGSQYDSNLHKGYVKDDKKAFEWYKKAADQGHIMAMVNVAACLARGQGVERDMAKAMKYRISAAEKGAAVAQYCLGKEYESGEFIRQDLLKAAEFYQLAAAQGHEKARKLLEQEKFKQVLAQLPSAPPLSDDMDALGMLLDEYQLPNVLADVEKAAAKDKRLKEAIANASGEPNVLSQAGMFAKTDRKLPTEEELQKRFDQLQGQKEQPKKTEEKAEQKAKIAIVLGGSTHRKGKGPT